MAQSKPDKRSKPTAKGGAPSPIAPSPRRQRLVVAAVCAALVLACFAVYGRTLSHAFVNFDDNLYVTENPQVQAGLHLQSAAWAFTTDKALYFHPLTWMSHMLDCSLYGLHPWGHHLTNLLFHSAASVLLFLALRLMTGALWPSAAVAALFAVHPLHVESVAWIAERKDVLSAFFWMLALGAYGLYVRRRGAVRYAAVTAAFVLGLMSKPMVVTLPFALLLLDYWPLGRVDRTAPLGSVAGKTAGLAAEKIPLFLITAVSCASTLVMQIGGNNLSFGQNVPFAARGANALVVYALYVVKMVWPSGLAVYYPHPLGRPAWQIAGATVALAAITLFCLREARRRPYLIVGWLWYLGTLVPVIELVQAGKFSHADRYTYLPSIGVFIMAAWGVADLAAAWRVPRSAVAAASGVAIVMLTACAFVQTGYWHDNKTLFSHAVAVGQESSIAFTNLGKVAAEEGRYDEAKAYLNRALELDPGYGNALNDLGTLAVNEGRYDDAETLLKKALNLNQKDVEALYNLGVVAKSKRRYDEAEAYLKRALDLEPGYVRALNNLGVVAMDQGHNDEAAVWLKKALSLKPDHVNALSNLGKLAMDRGSDDEAMTYLKRALNLDPKCVPAMHNLGLCLMNKEQYEEAQRHFRKALEIDPHYAKSMKALGTALAKLGRREEADAWLKRAAESNPPRTDKNK